VGAGIISIQQVQTQRALVAQLQATMAGDVAALDRDRLQLGYTGIRAPFSGLLGLRLVDVGNVVSPSDAAGLVVLTQVQPITVLFALPQGDLVQIQTRRAASSGADLSVQAWSQDGSRQLGAGTLSALSNQVDAASGTVTLKGVFPNPNQILWPGEAVSVRLVLDVQHDGLTVPSEAIDQGPGGPFIWVIDPGGIARPMPVTLRQQLYGRALVSAGLLAGQQVVTNGQYGLVPGAHVAVQTPQARPLAAAVDNQPPLHTNNPNRLGISP
jgi:multidrug efflux system membrane fusion protein